MASTDEISDAVFPDEEDAAAAEAEEDINPSGRLDAKEGVKPAGGLDPTKDDALQKVLEVQKKTMEEMKAEIKCLTDLLLSLTIKIN